MKTYKIYANSKGKRDAVKQGWSWPGFFFNIIWMLIKKLWIPGIILVLLFVAFDTIEGIFETNFSKEVAAGMSAVTSIFLSIISIVCGINGNKWRAKKLISSGYDYKGTVNASNPKVAITLWFKKSNNN